MKKKIKLWHKVMVLLIFTLLSLGIILKTLYDSYLEQEIEVCKISQIGTKAWGPECGTSQYNFEKGKYKTFWRWIKGEFVGE
ncbi:MAG: hypothetical protein PHF46_01840 [Candidatus Gracilibacteria bacterium]|nr:hypothetical protein [Candidatus Gracilibacteria bacterium]